MSWVTIIWSMTASACLTLAAIYLLVWWNRRKAWASLLFSSTAAATAAMAACELRMMLAGTPGPFGAALRWLHVWAFLLIISLIGFVLLHMRAGRPWLAWTTCTLRAFSLLLNFLTGQNLNYREVTGLRHIPFLGTSVSVGEGVSNPWMLVGQLSLLLFVVFLADATLTVWRRGDRRHLLVTGVSIVFFVLAGSVESVLVLWQIVHWPYAPSFCFLGIIAAMACELSREVLRAAQLSDDLRASEELLREAAEAAGFGVYRYDLVSDTAFYSPEFLALYGLPPGAALELDSNRMPKAVHPDDKALFLAGARRSSDPQGSGILDSEFRVVRSDGQVRWLRAHGRTVFAGEGPARRAMQARGTIQDVTERRQAEEDLRKSEENYRGIYDAAIEGMFRTSREGRILAANPALASMLGYGSAEEITRHIQDTAQQVWVDPEERTRYVRQLEAEGIVRAYECRFKRRDWTTLWVSLNTRAVRGPDGNVMHLDGFVEDISERRRVADALEKSENRFRAAFMTGADAYLIAERDTGRMTEVNDRMCELYGYTRDEFVGHTSHELGMWVYPEARQKMLEQLRKDGHIHNLEVFARKKNGEPFWVLYSVSELKSEGTLLILGAIHDITERKQREEALERIRWLQAETEKLGKIGGWEFDIDTGKQIWTAETYAIHEMDAARQVTVEDGVNFCAPDSKPVLREAVQRAIEHGTQFDLELQMVTAKGNRRHVHTIGKADPEHRRVYGFIQDTTARKQAEEALRTSEARLASGADLAGLGFYESIKGDGEIAALVDDRVREICGLPPEVASGVTAGRFWREHIHPDDLPRILDAQQRLIDGTLERVSAEYRYLHPERGERWVHHLAIVEKREGPGQPVRITGVLRDITERKRVERELAQQRLQLAHVARVSSMGQLASSLAHELNQPLGAILRNAEAAELLLADPSPDLDELRAILADIRSDDRRASDVIDRMRAMIKHRGIEREPLDLSRLAAEVIAILRPDADLRGVRLVLESGPTVPAVDGDRVQLQQVLLNLLLNAMDAVEGRPRGERRVSVPVRTQGATVEVSVSDNGPGIRPEMLPRVFEPFYTSKPNGLGMGLPIASTIVEAHGGRLRAENGPTGGAVFSFSLPVREE
jgi:PAS domain S-box-containing protein